MAGRDGRKRSWSAPRRSRRPNWWTTAIARIEKLNPELNAVIHELFERARGEASRRPARRTVPRRALLVEGSRRRAGRHAVLRGPGLRRRLSLHHHAGADPALHRRRLRHLRQDEHARARHSADDRAAALRAVAQPVGHRPLDRRVLRWFGGRSGVGHGPRRARQRRGRLHPDSRLVLRPRRAEADTGAQLGCARLRRHDGRSGGRARRDALGARLGGDPRRDGRSRSRRSRTGRRRCAVPPSRPPPPPRRRACAWRS